MKTVLDLNAQAAKKFFLTDENYFTGDLPPYFRFRDLLYKADDILRKWNLSNLTNGNHPKNVPNPNYDIITNKNTEYDWRKLTVINPLLYVNLVNCICNDKAWGEICERFKTFRADEHIVCSSIPVVKRSNRKQKAQQILNWLSLFEQSAVKQSLNFSHMACTDIVNCYSSIYTHSIAWALHNEAIAKERKFHDNLLGNIIDKNLRYITYDQTNGIPQGSVLMDFIAEIVLGYMDTLILEKLRTQGIEDYKILRYRDDFKIFTNSPNDTENILKSISDVCQHLGFRINAQKTFSTDMLISKSLKKERFLPPIDLSQKNYKIFLQLYNLSNDQQIAGGMQTLLSQLNKKIKVSKKDDIDLLVSIISDMAYRIPKIIPQAFTTISHIMRKEPEEQQLCYISKIKKKFSKKAYTNFVHIWLQRLSVSIDTEIEYEPTICKIIVDDSIELWDFSWLKPEFLELLKPYNLVNRYKLNHSKLPIANEETNIFEYR